MSFGRSMLDAWALDPAITYLNHGTVGAPPRRVLEAQQQLRDEIERQPSRFLLRDLSAIRVGQPTSAPGLLRQAADKVGAFLGVAGRDLVFVDNVTAAVTAVVGNLEFRPGDAITISKLAYGGVARAVGHAARRAGVEVHTIDVPFPVADDAQLVEAFDRAVSPRTRLVIIDHITAESAMIMPVAQIAERAKARGAMVLVDGAHAPGAIPVDISALGVDFYAATLHKWAWTPRSCGILWAAAQHQPGLHPPVVSWGLDTGFTNEFDWVGTRDPTPFLTAPRALDYMSECGVARVQSYNHDLAWQAGQLLTRRWGTSIATPKALIGTMVTVPLPERFGRASADAARLRDALLFEDHIEVQLHAWHGQLWTRVSAQIYNDLSDVERLADAVTRR
ncbi:MAG: aminotransferase class V-fold PLP-dependent enzyme [Acidobacteriota bacterium]